MQFRPIVRAGTNGKKTKPKTNEQTLEFWGETRMEYKRKIRVTN